MMVTHPDAHLFKFAGKNQVHPERRADVKALALLAFDDSLQHMLTLRDKCTKEQKKCPHPVVLTEGDNFEDGQDGRPCSPFSTLALQFAVRCVQEGFEKTALVIVRKQEPLYSAAFVQNWQTALEALDPSRVFFVTLPDDPAVSWKWEKKSTLTFQLAHRIYFIGTSTYDEHKYKTDKEGNFVLKDGERVSTTGYSHLLAIQNKNMEVRDEVTLVDL